MPSISCYFTYDDYPTVHRRCSNDHNTTFAMCRECSHCEILSSSFSSFIHDCFIQAVNAPLQERTSVLDMDFSRATQLPPDYETDLELEWSNPSERLLFPLQRERRYCSFSRSVCWGWWLLVNDDRSRSKSLLSATISPSSNDTSGRNDFVVDQWTESTSESWSTLHHQQFICVHVIRKIISRFSSPEETDWISLQCSSSSSIGIQRLSRSPDHSCTSSSSPIPLDRSIEPSLSSRRSSHWPSSATRNHRWTRICRRRSR